jgi:hypothetical protein
MVTKIVVNGTLPQTLKEAMVSVPDYHHIGLAIDYHNKRASESYLIIGYFLCLAEKQRIWEHDGAGANSFFQWCENVRKIKRTSAQRMMLVWKTFAVYIAEYGDIVTGIDPSKLALIAPYMSKLGTDDERLELLHSAEVNSVKDLNDNLRELAGRPTQDTCPHSGKRIILELCCCCNKVLRKEEI